MCHLGHDVPLKSRSYLNALHRSRRNHRVDDSKNKFDDGVNNYDDRLNNYDDEDLEYDDDDDYEIIKKAKRGENLQYRVNKWLKMADRAEYIDPYDLDVFMEPTLPIHRKTAKEESVKLVASKLNRIRALEERLRHIEKMKRSLNKKIRELQLLKERESNTKQRIENEVSEAEREWKYNVDRTNPGVYKPLDSLGDTSKEFYVHTPGFFMKWAWPYDLRMRACAKAIETSKTWRPQA